MLFNSYGFILFFLPLTILTFLVVAKFNRMSALGVLLIASLIFYGWNDYHYVLLLIFSILVNFFISQCLIATTSPKFRLLFLWIGIIFNLGLLSFFKYSDFFINNLNNFFNLDLKILNIALPIGISFFTFTQIAYLVDCYRGLVQKCQLLNYALFVTYFPHLIAGPIIHHKEIMPQFLKNRTFIFNSRSFVLGLTMFAIGLFKKSMLADSLGQLVSPIFDMHLQHIAMLDAWAAALAYTLELYFDFSGYSDMAIGLSLLIGVRLPVNFYSPYKSVNIIEFWRRWNMTLSRFLRDYLYIPLGGNRKGSFKRYLNLLITMLLGGLWHGANWTFVFWGLLHGIFLCINHGWIFLKNILGIRPSKNIVLSVPSRLITFLSVTIAWVYFRSPDFATANQLLRTMFLQKISLPEHHHYPQALIHLLSKFHIGFSPDNIWIASYDSFKLIFISFLIVWCLPNSYQLLQRYKPALLTLQKQEKVSIKHTWIWKPTLAWACASAFIFVLSFAYTQGSSIFLYFRF